jgi:hypothetical protein
MATKQDLEARESDCASTDDFVALANEALSDPVDKDYAKHLLQQAEMQCQLPTQYVDVARGFADGLGAQDYAKDLLEQAQQACFEGKEFAAVGHAFATLVGDAETGKTLLAQAVEEAKGLDEIMDLAYLAGQVDAELARSLLTQVEAECKDFDTLQKLVARMAGSDATAAKEIYQKADRFCGDMDATVAYARGAKEIFADDNWAAQILEAAESDCQFPKEFVALARGFKEILGRDDKIDELLEQGAEFAMSGEEHLDLAGGYWELKNDAVRAAQAYQQALPEVTDRTQLLALAKTVGAELGDQELAKQIYAKVEEKTTVAGDFVKLAQQIAENLRDEAYASEVYRRAEEKMSGVHDLINLAGAVLGNLDDRRRAVDIYEKALGKADDFAGLTKLLDAVQTSVEDDALIRGIFDKLGATADATGELLGLHQRAMELLRDKELPTRMLQLAEERVTSLDEMRKVVEAVTTHAAKDQEWVARVTEKLHKREANQARYAQIQKQEEECTAANQFLRLADQVIAELEDKFYARKLISKAEEILQDENFDFSKYQALISSIDKNLQDPQWAEQLYRNCIERCRYFADVQQIARSALSTLTDRDLGNRLAREFYQAEQEKLDGKSFADTMKLADAILRDLGDHDWAEDLLGKAVASAEDHFDLAHAAQLATRLDDTAKAASLYQQAADHCRSAADLLQLATRMQRNQVDEQMLKDVYRSAGATLSTPGERLKWAEGIITLFADREWARQAYDDLKDSFTDDERQRAAYNASRQHRLERRL